ncbi:hypothetical protein [Elizabethkingia anophelis]|uniref:hypothetical protein n=1 Tax=Elizabethkingia anophelis TaxID=1117645 RepID=UPI00320AD0D7|nr:hypothetical protein [Elizabethkingia anophelis]
MKKNAIILYIILIGTAIVILAILSFQKALLQNLSVKILLSLCVVFGLVLGRILDNSYNRKKKKLSDKMSKEVDEIGKE